MTATSNIGMNLLAPSSSCGVAASKTSDQPQQSFIESLYAASKSYPETGSAKDGNTRAARWQKSTSEDKEATDADHRDNAAHASNLTPQAVQPQQVIPAQQTQVNTPEPASLSLSFGGAVTTAVTSTEAAVQLADVQSSIIHSDNDQKLASSIQSDAAIQDNKAPGIPQFETGNSISSAVANVAANTVSNTVPNLVQAEAAAPAQNVVLNEDSNAPSEAALSASPRENHTSTVIDAPVDQAISSTIAVDPNLLAADLKVSSGAASQLVSPVQPDVRDATNDAAGLEQHAQLTTDLNVSGGTANQLVSPIQPGSGLPETVHASVPSFNMTPVAKRSVAYVANGKDESKDSHNSAEGLKQHVPLTADHAGSKTYPQQDASAGDQNQSGASSQQQSATLSQMNSTNNSVVTGILAQNTPTAFSSMSASMHASVTASTTKLPEAAASASAAVTRATPVINTAKLIQSIGQSVMRVGMRSSEFGNISISTTANKDVISAQISLDHGELAKALAAQLPEMQARLGGNQPMDVRIDMNGATTGQGAGTSGGMSNGSSEQSNADKQQSAYAASSYTDSSVVERPLYSVAAGMTTGNGSLDARLDIRA